MDFVGCHQQNPPVCSSPPLLELFVDGTSAWPGEAKLRFAAWAVTLVHGGVGTWDNQVLMAVMSQGCVKLRSERSCLRLFMQSNERSGDIRLCDSGVIAKVW